MRSKLLLVLSIALLAGCGDSNQVKPKEIALTDTVSLRDLPGDDGCMPAPMYTPPHAFKGEPSTCVDATTYN